MANHAKPLPVRLEAARISVDFRGLDRGIQQRIHDLLRGLSEVFTRVRSKNRHVVANLSTGLDDAYQAFIDLLVQAGIKLKPFRAEG